MKKTIFLFLILLTGCISQTSRFIPEPTSFAIQYPDSILPGSEPEPFGEDFFKGSFHSSPTFSADGTQMWWAGDYSIVKIYTSQYLEGLWSQPQDFRLSESIQSYRDPFLSPDGSRLYFISEEKYPNSEIGSSENIWMAQKDPEGWGEPQPLPESINSLELHWTISVDNDYNLYFSARKDNNWDLFVSRFVEGNYAEPQKIETPVSTNEREFTPNIAPDGSYLLFSRMPLTTDIPSLYISYRSEDGWSEPIKIENVLYCISPVVTPDQKFVIFLSSPSSFSWRDTSFINDFRP